VTNEQSSKVRVLVGTTEGPVDLLSLVQEKPVVRRSDVYIGTGTERAGIGRSYHEFVSAKTGVVERLFGRGVYRIDVSRRIDAGSSWQLGFFVAHAIKAAGRFPGRDGDGHDSVVWASGTVRREDLLVGGIGYLARKLTLSLQRLSAEVQSGRRVVVAYPAANATEVDAELRRSIEATGATIVEVENVRALLRALELPPIPLDVSAADKVWSGTPFRNLEPFEGAHRDIFFGRGRAREEALERLWRAAARDFAVLLVHGRSGAGKSSLVRAGLIGDIKSQTSAAEVWLELIITPQRSAQPPLCTLVDGLMAELRMPAAITAASLLEDIRSRNPLAIEVLVGAIAAAGGGRQCKLILVVDQLEEILVWAREQGDAEATRDREAFGELIVALSRTGAVWTIATLRSDMLAALEDSVTLSRLAQDDNMYRLERPSRMEFREIIQRPLAVARLALEGSDASGLPFADVLIDKASASPDSLPLLQFVLSRLFELEGRSHLLTYAMYERLGGLEGAISRLAEDTIQALAGDGVSTTAMDQVILNLARYDRELATISARWASLPHDSTLRDQSRILEALARARLLVLDEGGRARVAHEAVLTHWPRARTLFESAARDLDLRDVIEADAEAWEKQGCDAAILIQPGRRLSEAADLASANRVLLSEVSRRYVEASLAAARRLAEAENLRLQAEARKERSWRRRAVAAGVVLALFAALAAWFATDAREQARIARAQTKVANEKSEEASRSAALARAQEQRALAAAEEARNFASEAALREAAARSLVEITSAPQVALANAIGALKTNLESGKPLLGEVYFAAAKTLDAARDDRRLTVARPWLTGIRALAPSPDGKRILVATAVAIHLLDLEGRQQFAPIGDDADIVVDARAVAWQPSGEHFIVAQEPAQGLRLYRADGTLLRTLVTGDEQVTACVFVDKERVAAVTSAGRLVVVSIGGDIVAERSVPAARAIVAMETMGRLLVGAGDVEEHDGQSDDGAHVGREAVAVPDTETSREAGQEPAFVKLPGAHCLAGRPTHGQVAVCGARSGVELWQFVDAARLKHAATIDAGPARINAIAFHPSGRFFAAAGEDGLVRLIATDSGEAIVPPLRRGTQLSAVSVLAFVDDARRLVSDCGEGLCMWDVADLGLEEVPTGDVVGVGAGKGGFVVGDNEFNGGWSLSAVAGDGVHHVVTSSPTGGFVALAQGRNSDRVAFVTSKEARSLDRQAQDAASQEVAVFDLGSGRVIWRQAIPSGAAVGLAFAHDNSMLGVVISQESQANGKTDAKAVAQRRSKVSFMLFDAGSGAKQAELVRDNTPAVLDIVGMSDRANPPFVTLSANGALERWSADLHGAGAPAGIADGGGEPQPRSKLALSPDEGFVLASVGASVGMFDSALNALAPIRKLEKEIDAIAVAPEGRFYALIARTDKALSTESRVLRLYQPDGRLLAEKLLFQGGFGGVALQFQGPEVIVLQSTGRVRWLTDPNSVLEKGEGRLSFYAKMRQQQDSEKSGEQALDEHRYRDAALLFANAIEIDPIGCD